MMSISIYAQSTEQQSFVHAVVGLFQRLADALERRQLARQEAYLADFSSTQDLERRMVELERQNFFRSSGV